MEGLPPKFLPIFDTPGRLDTEYTAGRVRRRGESLHLYLLGGVEQFSGRGIAQQLVTRCLANAARREYRPAVTEAANRTSQHIFRKQGFAGRVSGSYRDHRYEGKAFLRRLRNMAGLS
jgi:GNAT superfamily N-acetyltransferase